MAEPKVDDRMKCEVGTLTLVNAAAFRLRSTNDKLGVIAADAGYETAAAFTKAFKKHLGKTPGKYRRAH